MGLISFLSEKFDKESKILLKNTSWILGSNIIRTILVFLKSIVIARGLGVEFYGVYALIAAFVVTVQDFFNLNIGNAFIKFGAEFKTNERGDQVMALIKACLLATAVTATLSVLLISILVSFAYESFVEVPDLEWYIVFYAIADVATFFDPMGRSILRLYYKFKVNSFVQTITAVLEFIVITLTIFIYPKDLQAFFIAVVVSRIINTLINNGAGFYELRHELIPHLSAKMSLLTGRYREISGYIFGNSLSKTLRTLMNQGDVLLLGALTGPSQVGFYAVAKRMANMVGVISDPFTMSVFPQFSLLLSEKKFSDIKVMLNRITRNTILPAVLLLIISMLLSEWVITLAFGEEYSSAAGPFRICIIGSVLTSLFFWNQSLMQSFGLIAFRFYVYLGAVIAGGLTSYFILVPEFGTLGMAAGMVFTKVITIITFTFAGYSKLNRSIEEHTSVSESKT
jgi:O-antigen/teichoic acid export membrane protein